MPCTVPAVRAILVLALLSALPAGATPTHHTFRIEAEAAGAEGAWSVRDLDGASGGKVLAGTNMDHLGESRGISLAIPRAGRYVAWVRYHKQDRNCCAFYALFRDESREDAAFHKCDFVPVLPTSKPYAPKPEARPAGFQWEQFSATFERPLLASVSFGGYLHRGGYGHRLVDCVLLTDDSAFDPRALDAAGLQALPPAPTTAPKPTAPAGWTPAGGFPTDPAFFAGVPARDGQFRLGLIHNASLFANHAQALHLGFNRDHGARGKASGVLTIHPAEKYGEASTEFARRHPAPEGRFVNAAGQVGSLWSLPFPPLRDELPALLEKAVVPNAARDDIEFWRISGEAGGYLDYSPASQTAFREWLAAKHGTVARLNERWGSAYNSFEEIVPPKAPAEGMACWLEFRDFCGTVFAEVVGRQLPLIRRLDLKRRPCIGQNSNLDMLAPYFTAMRPMDWEQYIQVALAGEPFVGWDTYCADDYLGCEIDLLRSISAGRHLLNQEWNIHAVDPRIAARTFWTQVGKGVRGIYCFMFQEGTYHDSYPKWALLRNDLSPKGKLAAFADCAHEVHRLEPLLTRAEATYAVKPVALYYSRLDLSLAQPHLSLWANGADSPFHVYETLRGLGYAVRWITPRQILAGELEKVGAVVMVDCQYVPAEAAARLKAWVEAGGVVVGDRWPGAWNEYGRPQETLAPIFGVSADTPKKASAGALAVQESSQGYGEVTIAAVDPKSLAESVGEIWQQWDSRHPVARAVGDFMLSGFGLQRARCTAGEVIGMTFDGRPGVVLNEFGRGKCLHFAMMMGSVFESGAAGYEWDSTHSGRAFARILDEFLRYSGVAHSSQARGNPRILSKLRVEAPLVTPDGNVLIGVASMNDAAVAPFPLEVALPANARRFGMVLVARGGGRQLERVMAQVKGGRLCLQMPGFDTHATILALRHADPLVGIAFGGAGRGPAGLIRPRAGCELLAKATVYNPSPAALPAGTLRVAAPRGWFLKVSSVSVPAIPAWGEQKVAFRVRAPEIAAASRLRPLVTRYQAGAVRSTPTTELMWWGGGQALTPGPSPATGEGRSAAVNSPLPLRERGRG